MPYIQFEVTVKEKNDWVRAAKPGKLVAWIKVVLNDEIARLKENSTNKN